MQDTSISPVERLAITSIHPRKIRELSDDALTGVWSRLVSMYGEAILAREPVEDYVNAGLWVLRELRLRGLQVEPDPLAVAVDAFASSTKGAEWTSRLKSLPAELTVVEDFVSVVGSTARGDPDPHDIDLLVNAPWDRDRGEITVKAHNVWLPIRSVLDPGKDGLIHYLSSEQGRHGDHVPLYDLVMRRRDLSTKMVKSSRGLKVDLGCGRSKPAGYIGLDRGDFDGVDIVCDLEFGIPLGDNCADEVRAMHVLEHLSNKSGIMSEIYRILRPGGRLIFEVPSTDGVGAFAHPDHRSFWNRQSFAFWTQPGMTDDRPIFSAADIEERREDDRVYVSGVLTKMLKNGIEPFVPFIPPKPIMRSTTELFEIQELWDWAESRLPVGIEPKLNGFRSVLMRKGDDVGVWFEGQVGRNLISRFPGLADELKAIDEDYVLDADIAIERGGKRVPRVQMAALNQDEPELAEGEKIVVTVFDVPYWGEDLTGETFETRRELLEKRVGGKLPITPIRWTDSKTSLRSAVRWAFDEEMSEGAMAKSAKGVYDIDGTTSEWSKIKRVAELKVIVLDVTTTKGGANVYRGGISPDESAYVNTVDFGGKQYIDLGETFSAHYIEAEPGDIITVRVLELIPGEEAAGETLSWLGAEVVDIDRDRETPYGAGQAIDIARRAHVLQKSLDIVPAKGPMNAPVAFVVDEPDSMEIARGELMVGHKGEIFAEHYLEPLGLERKDVVLAAVGDDEEWVACTLGELSALRPQSIVAVGDIAGEIMRGYADCIVPHPRKSALSVMVKRLGRKLKNVRTAMRKAAEDNEEGGETRGERAQDAWDRDWHMYPPKSGKGKFVYQHHWRGLEKDETRLSDSQLLDTDNSLHGDLRLEGDDHLWGWAVFLGEAAANRRAGGDKLASLKSDDALQLAPKIPQPKRWLAVGAGKGDVVKPGGVGATADAGAKFFVHCEGTYEIGVVTEHAIEIFLDSPKLSGRYMITYPRIGGRRVWLLTRPEDQDPRAETDELQAVIAEQRRKGRDWVIWSRPGDKPVWYDTQTGEPDEPRQIAKIQKSEPIKRIVYGVVFDPYDENGARFDAENEWIPPHEIEATAHDFIGSQQVIGWEHSRKADAKVVESWIEAYPSREDYLKAMRGDDHHVTRRKFGDDVLHSGSWVLGVRLGEHEWNEYMKGNINGFSPGGSSFKKPITAAKLPKVTFIDLVEKK